MMQIARSSIIACWIVIYGALNADQAWAQSVTERREAAVLQAREPPPPGEAAERRRLRLDRLVALHDRSRMLEVIEEGHALDAADEADRVGLGEAALIAARDQRIVIVHIESDGRHRIEAQPKSGQLASRTSPLNP